MKQELTPPKLCAHCKKEIEFTPSFPGEAFSTWWCSLPCKGHILQRYGEAQRFRYDREEQEYYEYLKALPKGHVPDGNMLIHKNARVREEAKRWLKD